MSHSKADTICVFASYNASVLSAASKMNLVDTNPYSNGLHHIGFNQDQGKLDNRVEEEIPGRLHSCNILTYICRKLSTLPISMKVQCKQNCAIVFFTYRTHAKLLNLYFDTNYPIGFGFFFYVTI